jgi:tRNA U34 5-methylaminomethyl-2-thiouridine-forming methyltransferase MnmC
MDKRREQRQGSGKEPAPYAAHACADGSQTLWNAAFQEHYHSQHGARTESEHVFIEAGLACAAAHFEGPLQVLEWGFGTGLNALLAAQWARNAGRELQYEGYEPYPIPWSKLEEWSWPDAFQARAKVLHEGLNRCLPGERFELQDAPSCRFILHRKRMQESQSEAWENSTDAAPVHVVFHDAFSPERDPDSWTQEVLDQLFQILSPGGYWVSYCAKGVVRRGLQQAGFDVERLPGPPFKREILRARKPIG